MTITEPILQVALDCMHLKRALQFARESVAGGVDWLEAGTPLIKSEGMEAVRALKREFPSHTIVADMKVADVGAYEVEMAGKAGAQVVHVLGTAHDETIKDAVRAGLKYGVKIAVDLISIQDRVERAKALQDMGISHICLHVGIDQQMLGQDPVEQVKALSKVVNIPIAVAGGINSETAARVVEAGASIIIAGGAILKAENVEEATRVLKKAISDREVIPTELFKKYSQVELLQVFEMVSTSNISDGMHRKGAMVWIVPRIRRKGKMVGRALTVSTMDGDWAKPVEAIDRANPGEVIVIDTNGGNIAIWGELASWSCKVKGIAGVVIDGCARDIQDILDMDFPVFSRHAAPHAGEPKGYGEIGGEITCGGQNVRTGDWIIGDESGVVVVPQERAVELANRALNVYEMENRVREEIKRGSTLSKVMELEKWEKVG